MKKDIQKLIYTLAARLNGNWFVNDKMRTQKGREGVFYLHDRNGIFITINLYEYGKKIPQIKLGYLNPKYKHLSIVKTIGCSLDKGLTSIKTDIESRLLDALPEAKNNYQQEKNEQALKQAQNHSDNNIIHALSCVYGIYKHHYQRDYPTYEFNDLDIEFKHLGGDNFQVSLKDVNLDKLIKIAQIVGEA